MGIKLTMTTKINCFDDNEDRQIAREYLENRGFEIVENDKYAIVDMSGKYKGMYYAIEVAVNASRWPNGSTLDNVQYFEIPQRKWKYFEQCLYPDQAEDFLKYDKGIYFLLSGDKTHVVMISFSELLREVDPTDKLNIIYATCNGKTDPFVLVPKKLIKIYDKSKKPVALTN